MIAADQPSLPSFGADGTSISRIAPDHILAVWPTCRLHFKRLFAEVHAPAGIAGRMMRAAVRHGSPLVWSIYDTRTGEVRGVCITGIDPEQDTAAVFAGADVLRRWPFLIDAALAVTARLGEVGTLAIVGPSDLVGVYCEFRAVKECVHDNIRFERSMGSRLHG